MARETIGPTPLAELHMNELAAVTPVAPFPAEDASETRRGARKMALQSGLAVALVLIAVQLASLAGAQSLPQELLKNLNLSTYPSPMIPPEFNGRTPEGRTLSLESLQGRVVFLSFWAAWCLECRSEMPVFEQVYDDFRERGFVVLGVNYRDHVSEIERFATDLNLTFPLVLDPTGEIRTAYGVIGFPTTFLIGRDGRAVALAVGPRKWDSPSGRAIIDRLLAQPAAPRVTE